MYAIDEAILEAFRKYRLDFVTDYQVIFNALARCGTDDEVDYMVYYTNQREHTYHTKHIDVSILVALGREKLAISLVSFIIVNHEILINAYMAGCSDEVIYAVADAIIDDASLHIVRKLMTHLIAIEDMSMIGKIINRYGRHDLFNDCVKHERDTEKIIRAMMLRDDAYISATAVVISGDMRICDLYISRPYRNDTGITHLFSMMVCFNKVDMIHELMRQDAPVVRAMAWAIIAKYLPKLPLDAYVACDNEDALLIIADCVAKSANTLRYIIYHGYRRLAQRIIARRDATDLEESGIEYDKKDGVDYLVHILSMSHPPRVGGKMKVICLPARIRAMLNVADRACDSLDVSIIARMIAWRPIITLSGRWSVVSKDAYVDAIIVCP